MSFLEMMDVLNEQLMEQGLILLRLITNCREEFAVLVQCL